MNVDHQPEVPQEADRPSPNDEAFNAGKAAEQDARTADQQDDGTDGLEDSDRGAPSVEPEWKNDRTLPDEYYDEPTPGAPADPKSDSLTPSPEHQQTLDDDEQRKADRTQPSSASANPEAVDRTPDNSATFQGPENDSAARTARTADQQDDGTDGLEDSDRGAPSVEPEWNNDRTLPDEYYDEPPPGAPAEPRSDSLTPSPEP